MEPKKYRIKEYVTKNEPSEMGLALQQREKNLVRASASISNIDAYFDRIAVIMVNNLCRIKKKKMFFFSVFKKFKKCRTITKVRKIKKVKN